MSKKEGYEVREDNVIQNVVTKGWKHGELTIGTSATSVLATVGKDGFIGIPNGTKFIAIHNDSGADLRYGESDVIWEAATSNTNPRRGIPLLNGRGISFGICDADEFHFAADIAGRKIAVLFGI